MTTVSARPNDEYPILKAADSTSQQGEELHCVQRSTEAHFKKHKSYYSSEGKEKKGSDIVRCDIWLSAQLSTLTWLSGLSLSICRGIRKKFPQNEIWLTAFCPLKRWWWIPENIRSPRWEMSFSEEVSSGTFRQNRTGRRETHAGNCMMSGFF